MSPDKSAIQSAEPAASAALDFARLIGRLKTTPRTGWVRRGVPRYESVADHSWRVSALTFLLKDESVDVSKCTSLAVVHDMAECVVGDIPDDNVSKHDKQRMEQEAMHKISIALQKATSPGCSLMDLFHEYEQRESIESKVVKDLDLLDMIIQADEYEQAFGMDLSDFFYSTPAERFQNEQLRQIAQQLHLERDMRRQQEKHNQKKKAKVGPNNGSNNVALNKKDTAFIEEFCKATKMVPDDVVAVIQALRAWEDRTK